MGIPNREGLDVLASPEILESRDQATFRMG